MYDYKKGNYNIIVVFHFILKCITVINITDVTSTDTFG
jgi:hypothetical protein